MTSCLRMICVKETDRQKVRNTDIQKEKNTRKREIERESRNRKGEGDKNIIYIFNKSFNIHYGNTHEERERVTDIHGKRNRQKKNGIKKEKHHLCQTTLNIYDIYVNTQQTVYLKLLFVNSCYPWILTSEDEPRLSDEC